MKFTFPHHAPPGELGSQIELHNIKAVPHRACTFKPLPSICRILPVSWLRSTVAMTMSDHCVLPRKVTFEAFANAMGGDSSNVWETQRSAARNGWSATIFTERLVLDFCRMVDDPVKIMQTISDIETDVERCKDWPARSTVSLILSPDESVLGRCATVQRGTGCTRRISGMTFVTLIDSRLTADRMAHLANVVWRVVHGTDLGGASLDLFRDAIARVVASWAAIRTGGGEPLTIGAEPDLERMAQNPCLFARATSSSSSPAPRRALSLCGGRAIIATVDRETSERVAHCQRITTSRAGAEASALLLKCTPLRHAIKRAADQFASGGERTHVIMVDQRAGVDFAVFESVVLDSRVTGQLITGVPAYQLCAQAVTLALDGPRSWFGDSVLSEMDIRDEQRLRLRRTEAASIIRRLMGQDCIVRRIKEHVWRPDGRLMRQQYSDEQRRASKRVREL